MKSSPFKVGGWWFPVLLVVLVLLMYAPSVRFGLIWDDPVYYQRGLAQSSLGQILASLQGSVYFTPGIIDRVVISASFHKLDFGTHVFKALPVFLSFSHDLFCNAFLDLFDQLFYGFQA